jgi:hypothetical protein
MRFWLVVATVFAFYSGPVAATTSSKGFKSALYDKIRDRKKAALIYDLYTAHIFPALSKEEKIRNAIQAWIVRDLYYLGSPYCDNVKRFSSDANFRGKKIPREVLQSVKRFLREARQISDAHAYEKYKDSQRIKLLLLSNSSEGEKQQSLVQALQEALGTTSAGERSHEEVPTIAVEVFDIKGESSSQEELMERLKQEIRNKKPDQLISFLPHYPQFIDLAYSFSTPLSILVEPKGVPAKLFKENEALNSGLVQVWVAGKDKSWTKNLREKIVKFRESYLAAQKKSAEEPFIKKHEDHAGSFDLVLKGRDTFDLARDWSLDGLSAAVKVEKPKQALPPIVAIFLDTVRADYAAKPSNAPFLTEFAKNSIVAGHMVASATSTQHTQTALMYSMPALYRESLVRHNWSSGSPTLQLFKRAGYTIRLMGRPNYYFALSPAQSSLLYENGAWDDITQLQVKYGQDPSRLLQSATAHDHKFWDFERYTMAEGDRYVLAHELPSTLNGQETGLYLIYLEASHDRYSWSKDLPRLKPYSQLFEPSSYNNKINRSPYWLEQHLEGEVFKAYRNAVRNTDKHLSQIIARLKEKKIYDKALVMIFSDHGERLYDGFADWYRGMSYSSEWVQSNIGHGGPPYKPVIEVPFMVKPPAGYAKADLLRQKMQETVLSHENIYPLALEIAGIDYSSEQAGDKPLLARIKDAGVLSKAHSCQLTFNPNGSLDPYIFAFVSADKKAFMHLHYQEFLLDEPNFSKVKIRVDAITDLNDKELQVVPAQVEEFFRSNFSECLAKLGIAH